MLRRGLFLAAVLAGCTPAQLERADVFRSSPREPLGRPVLSLRWKLATADRRTDSVPQEFAGALVIRDTIYIGSQHGELMAVRADTGKIRWRTKLGSISSTPIADRGWLYIGTDDGELCAIDIQTGEVKWRYASRGAISEPPVIVGDAVIFANEADQVTALDALKGTYRWQYRAETPEEFTLRGHAGVASSGDLVYTGFSNGTLVALRPDTGSVAWLTSLKGAADRFMDVDATPVVVGPTLYVTSSSGGAFAVDGATGLVRWNTPLADGTARAQPVGNAGAIASDGHFLYAATADQGVFVLDLDGNVVWRQGTRGGGEPAQPIVSGDLLIYTLASDGMFVADKRTGKVHQYFDPGDGISATPTITDDDRVFVMSNHGILYALDLHRD